MIVKVALDVLANMVRNLGWHADVANNGVQALDLIRSLSDEKRAYDVILLDWQMPNMSGIDMLERLDENERDEAFYVKSDSYYCICTRRLVRNKKS
ncbi:response regulator [Paucibacter sp. O1-1]|nr:response regulator [Paucibacter sp. O1-1]MDA3830125.1 response regulator [Paucibacter sp. O1-1]